MRISSIFRTLDGESPEPLKYAIFVRTGGCHIRCWKSTGFCDAPHTLDLNHKYAEVKVEHVAKRVNILAKGKVRACTITGGEPWLQKDECMQLAYMLREDRIFSTLETSGTLPMAKSEVVAFAHVVMDIKPPSTEMHEKNVFENLEHLRGGDVVKVVLSDENDFEWALDIIRKYDTSARVRFGVRAGCAISLKHVFEWLEENKAYDIGLNMQLHKLVFKTKEPFYKDLKDVDYAALERAEV